MEVTRKQINILWKEIELVTFASSEKSLLDPAKQRIRRGKRSHYRDLYPDFFIMCCFGSVGGSASLVS